MTDTSVPEVFVFPTKDEKIQHYELMLLVSGNATDEEAAKTFSEVKALFEAGKAEITHEEVLGRRALAYSIDDTKMGSYFIAEFDLVSTLLPELNEKLRIRKDVARFMIIKKKKRTAEEIAKDQEIVKRREEYRAKKMIDNATKDAAPVAEVKKVDAPKADTATVEKGIDKLLGEDVEV
jgi:ribosomal protein S6